MFREPQRRRLALPTQLSQEDTMPSIAFVAPIAPGKTDLLRQAAESQAPGGVRRMAYEASRERHGITREASWIQPTPMGDLTVVYIEADDLEAMFDGLGSSQDPFDVWFREQTREVHGINIEDGVPSPEQILTFEAHTTAA
jgi:hypothetical protein